VAQVAARRGGPGSGALGLAVPKWGGGWWLESVSFKVPAGPGGGHTTCHRGALGCVAASLTLVTVTCRRSSNLSGDTVVVVVVVAAAVAVGLQFAHLMAIISSLPARVVRFVVGICTFVDVVDGVVLEEVLVVVVGCCCCVKFYVLEAAHDPGVSPTHRARAAQRSTRLGKGRGERGRRARVVYLLDADDAAVQLGSVDALHGVLRLDVRAHRHERETPRIARPRVAHLWPPNQVAEQIIKNKK